MLYIDTMRSSHPIAKRVISTGLPTLLLLLLLAATISDVASAADGVGEEQGANMESAGATAFWKILSSPSISAWEWDAFWSD